MAKNVGKINTFLSLISVIKNSEKSQLFKHLYLTKHNKNIDILKNGRLSCAVFVTSVLKMFDLVQSRHATVSGAVQDLLISGWELTNAPQVGCVLVWESQKQHKHIGFYLGKKIAMSNDSKLRHPIKHHWTYGQKNDQAQRKIESILIYPDFYFSSDKFKTKNNKTKPQKKLTK